MDLLCIRPWWRGLEHLEDCFFRRTGYTSDAKRRPLRAGIARQEVALLYGGGRRASQDASRWGRRDGLCARSGGSDPGIRRVSFLCDGEGRLLLGR